MLRMAFGIDDRLNKPDHWFLSKVNKAFQRRWCTLRGNLLFYSEKKGDKEPLGVIILEGCTVELAEEETEHYAFKVISTLMLQHTISILIMIFFCMLCPKANMIRM